MLIACKFEEIYPPTVGEFAYITADTYTTERILETEKTILRQLDYQLNKPSPIMFLRRYSKLMSTDRRVHNLAKYILELSLIEPANSCLPSSKKAGAALLLAATILSPDEQPHKLWCTTLVVYSKYEVDQLQETRIKLKRSLIEGHGHKQLKAIREKYMQSEYLHVSTLKALDKSTELF